MYACGHCWNPNSLAQALIESLTLSEYRLAIRISYNMDDADYDFETHDPEFTLTPNDENSDRATHTPTDNTGNDHSNVIMLND